MTLAFICMFVSLVRTFTVMWLTIVVVRNNDDPISISKSDPFNKQHNERSEQR